MHVNYYILVNKDILGLEMEHSSTGKMHKRTFTEGIYVAACSFILFFPSISRHTYVIYVYTLTFFQIIS